MNTLTVAPAQPRPGICAQTGDHDIALAAAIAADNAVMTAKLRRLLEIPQERQPRIHFCCPRNERAYENHRLVVAESSEFEDGSFELAVVSGDGCAYFTWRPSAAEFEYDQISSLTYFDPDASRKNIVI